MELWDIYDANNQPTGRTMRRNDWHMKPGEFHLTVLGVIARPDGTFLITKRVMTKAWAPGWWEVSGGAAQAGESSWEAVRREVREETGLDVSKADGGYLFTYRRINPDEGDNYFVDVYRFVMDIKDEDLHLQEEETDGYRIATLDEIKGNAAEGKFLHYDSIRQAFELKQKNKIRKTRSRRKPQGFPKTGTRFLSLRACLKKAFRKQFIAVNRD